MDRKLFSYDLPRSFIAQKPLEQRDSSKLMILHRDSGIIEHKRFKDIVGYFKSDDILVINDSKVIPARIESIKKETGGQVRFLLIKRIGEGNLWEGMIEKGKSLEKGMTFSFFDEKVTGTLVEKMESKCVISFSENPEKFYELLDKYGSMPLPPYIKRNGNKVQVDDRDRYQTVYADEKGSIAAPTAGLHFTNELLQKVEGRGVTIVKITLHVGKGTFIPIKTQNIEEHRMEEEEYFISEKSADILNQALEEEKRIIAVGTTTTRALENEISKNGKFTAGRERADIFIYPGYKFKAINALITNFHLPQSTLLALVSAFCGRERILSAYECAKENGYRFYSYGDAMLII